jgi:hypothetical protein
MEAQTTVSSPPNKYFAALLPLCKNLIMDGKTPKSRRSKDFLDYIQRWGLPPIGEVALFTEALTIP